MIIKELMNVGDNRNRFHDAFYALIGRKDNFDATTLTVPVDRIITSSFSGDAVLEGDLKSKLTYDPSSLSSMDPITANREEGNMDVDDMDEKNEDHFIDVCGGKDHSVEHLDTSFGTNTNTAVMKEEADACEGLHTYDTTNYLPLQLTILVNISWILSQKQNIFTIFVDKIIFF